jgi:MFS family permease
MKGETAETGAARLGGWYYGWYIIAGTVLAQIAANGLSINAFSLFLHAWSADLHSPISSLQLAMVPLGFTTAVFGPILGSLADKYPARWLIGGGLLGMALFYLGISAMVATWQFLALYGALLPIALSLSTSIVANALVSRWFVRRIGLALGLTAFGVGMAGVLLPPIVAAALPMMGWRSLWRLTAFLIAVIVAPVVILILRDRPTARDGLVYVTPDSSSEPHKHDSASRLKWGDIIRRKNYWLLVAVFLPVLATFGGIAYNLAPIAASRGFDQAAAGKLLSVLGLTHVCSTVVFGMLSDRFGNRRPLAGLAVVTAAGAALIGIGHSFPSMVLGVSLLGLSGGLWTLIAAAIGAEFGAANVGLGFGMMLMFLPINNLSPFAIAKVQESTGSYAAALLTFAVLVLAGGAVILLMREKRRGRASAPELQSA